MSDSFEPRACKGCGRKIQLVKDADGKIHPLDLSAPTFTVEEDMTGTKVAVRSSAFVSHFSTCPKVDQFAASKGIQK
jgi:hypothetical protein